MRHIKAPYNNVFYRNQNWRYPKIQRGEGIYLYDVEGNKYLDGCAGSAVSNIGHGNKEIADYAKEQIERIAFTHLSRWTVDTIEDCAKKIADWTPGDLNHVYFVSGGSEANETAIKMARQYFIERDGNHSSKWKIISKWNSFHGNTFGSLSVTGITDRRQIFDPYLIPFPKIPQYYLYRNPWDAKSLHKVSIKAAEALEEEIMRQGEENIAAFITEPVVGSAAPGVHPDKVYFEMVREICDRYDILLIVDEVMSGAGRTGKTFAMDHYGIVPDIMTSAKGLSCGYTPIGAAVANNRVFEAIMLQGSGVFIHGHTFAGNPLSCGIAHKVMSIIEREGYIDNAAKQGKYLYQKLKDLYDYPIVGDIRGKGLMIGIEFVRNKETKETFPSHAAVKQKLTRNCLEEGLVIYPGCGSMGRYMGDHILITPPINITTEEVDLLYDLLKKGIEQTCEQLKNEKF